ncbi:DUF7931 domain-containing protein [Thalassobius sp. S69A]|uniref:DUF7931 domain-containing protein n=1 Tax=unclassified Thalassovita TaxID=2619711 RepID=UPI000C0CBCCA|nr:hypothetical protein [Paracoccaceae bacterium]MBT27050.1 hypothetical protein [Paracoccaceae bacterium]
MFDEFGAQLEKYRALVLKAAKERRGDPVYNGSLEHAAILAENLFKFSEKEVCVLSGSLNPRVFGNRRVLDRAAEFLGKAGCSVQILIERSDDVDWEDHPFVQKFKSSSDLEVRTLQPDQIENLPFHFIVADSDSYRFEKDKGTSQAIGAFGDSEGGARLKGIFSELWQEAEKKTLQ